MFCGTSTSCWANESIYSDDPIVSLPATVSPKTWDNGHNTKLVSTAEWNDSHVDAVCSLLQLGCELAPWSENNIFLAACSPLLDVVTSPKIAEALTVRHLPEKNVWTDLSCFRIVSLLSNRSTLQWRIDLWSELWWRMSKPSPRLSSATFRYVDSLCNNSAHLSS
jgi:hypothetical protein